MRLRYTFRFRQIGETYLGAVEGQNAHLFNGVLQLNEVGHFIVSELAELSPAQDDGKSAELTERECVRLLTQRLMEEYDVDAATAEDAIISEIDYMRNEGVLTNE